MHIEVESNPNSEQSIFARFKELRPRRRVVQVKSFEHHAEGESCWVTGWTDDPLHPGYETILVSGPNSSPAG
jgi:hypothetical protein